MEKAPNFSLIICTYQRAKPLLKLLQSVKEQTLYPNEILIIDGSTNEETKDILEQVDLAVIQGEIGVAENGTIWVPESNMLNRVLPFITQHLVLVLDKNNIVANMHQAYDKLEGVGSYGVFIAGPSKTADIEQALVLGAHGPLSMTVYLIK